MEISAPGVVKLFGEHAVVYGKTAVAAAVEMRAYVRMIKKDNEKVKFSMPDLNFSSEFSYDEAEDAYNSYKESEIGKFAGRYERLKLPYMVIFGRMAELSGKRPGLEINLSSKIPFQRGFASSGACSVALAKGAARAMNFELDDRTMIDVSRDGERVMHINRNAGGIDVSTSFYGGVVSYKAGDVSTHKKAAMGVELVIVDTGPKKSTAETVGHVSELYKTERRNTEMILGQIDECSMEGLKALEEGDMKRAGEIMLRNHDMLRMLGVSSDGLDRAVRESKNHGAYGMKLSGGGGGGIAIALPYDRNTLIEHMKSIGFEAYSTRIAKEGVVVADRQE